ncbi:hypothetical protein V8E53_008586 [Lactarius tabidus]
MRFKLFSRTCKRRRPGSRLAASGDGPPGRGTTVVFDPTRHITTPDDTAMSAIQTALAVLMAGSSFATKLPFIAPIAGLILQALTMRDEVKQCKEECEIVMRKLARVGRVFLNVCELCERHNLSEEELPASLRDVLSSLQRDLNQIEQVLKKCSKRKGFIGALLRKSLLAKIKQCDGKLSNVLQAFQCELGLELRFALIVQRREEAAPDSGPNEAKPAINQEPNAAQGTMATLDALWCIALNAKELISGPILIVTNVRRSRATLLFAAFFLSGPQSPVVEYLSTA